MKHSEEMTAQARIERRPLGKSGIVVSRLGLAGSFGIDADAVERAYHEFGINYFFVTPRMKGLVTGIKRLIAAGHREDLVIAAGASIPTGGGVERSWAKQAKLFGVDSIDVFHLFWVQADWYVSGRTWPAMQKLKQTGKVRALAMSCHDRPRARAFVDELSLDALMLRYNAAHRGAEREVFDSLGDERPGIVSYTATRWGRLLKTAGGLGPMTGPECYRFVLGHPKVDVALCGARDFAELAADVAGVLAGPLPAQRLAEVQRFGDAVRKTATGRIGFLGV
ncbi:MAG TPA: aldo/keto reductase [Polyangiaceae bacterium]|nr:aldo/keto reductase [Polyangiaceae bacterium]